MPISHRTVENIHEFTVKNGGFGGRPKAHALKLLGEAVELAVAAGAEDTEIACVVEDEINKAHHRKEYVGDGQLSWEAVRSELADVAILLEIFCKHYALDLESCAILKLTVLEQRAWAFDQDGVLRRPV